MNDAPFFEPMKEQSPATSEQEYRQRRVKAAKLSESLDAVATVDASLNMEQNDSVVKNAVIDWGRKRP